VLQNPFDLVSISNLIHQIKPDAIVETGTANGGSALMWATALELAGLNRSKIITMDLYAPGSQEAFGQWQSVNNPKDHPLWAKYVVFLEGDTLASLENVQGVLRNLDAKKVLVLLDSGHEEAHVLQEMEAYCTLVTPGSYCIVEDTKISRFSGEHEPGPSAAINKWLKNHVNFLADKEQELFYTQHPGGYLKHRG
jgi:cephalosporin hydroxylase